MKTRRRFRFGRVTGAFTILLVAALALSAFSFRSARADPVVRRATVALPDWPAGAGPVRVLLWSDLHLGNAATGERRLARLVTLANALHPDLIVLAGDYVAGHEREDARTAVTMLPALRRLRAPLGVVAVLGNHEYWSDAPPVRAALERAGVTVLANGAVRRGPLAIGGVDDVVNDRADVPATLAAARAAGGAIVLVSHSPDLAPFLPADAPLLLAGHSHCGQIVLPLLGAVSPVTQLRYRCGLVREARRRIVITAGTGTSVVPLRFGARPDWWLLTLGPRR